MDDRCPDNGFRRHSSIALRSGLATDSTRTMLRTAPDIITKGRGVTLTATVIDTSTLSTVPENGGVTFTDGVQGKIVVLNGGAPVTIQR